jgi:hypothetical protein
MKCIHIYEGQGTFMPRNEQIIRRTWLSDVHFPGLLSTVIRSQFQVKPTTFLVTIDNFLCVFVEEIHGTQHQTGSFSLINVGVVFHCLRCFLFFQGPIMPRNEQRIRETWL